MEPHTGFNNLDYIVIGIILLSGLLALARGFVREIFSLIAWAGASFAAFKFYPLLMPMAQHHIKNEKAAEWAATVGIFVVTLVVLMVIGSLVCGLIKGRALTSIDRSLGFVYGLARGVLVVSLVYLGVITFMWPDINEPPKQSIETTMVQSPESDNKDHSTPPELLLQAKTRPVLDYFAQTLKALVPKEMIDKTLKNAEEQKDATEKAAKQHMLDNLSTPEPPAPTTANSTVSGNKP